MQIKIPCFIDGLPNADYHSHPAVSKSGLDALDRSAAHYWTRYRDPDRIPRKETPALEYGTAVHSAILEPDKFESDYIRAPKFDRRTKAGKAAAESFAIDNPGKLWLACDDFDSCLRTRDIVHDNPTAGVILSAGYRERSFFWREDSEELVDPTLPGVECRVRPDFIASNGGAIVDLKTTEDARAWQFSNSIWRYRYYVQAAFYLHGVEQSTGKRPDIFIFVALEKEPPYAVSFYFADDRMIASGMKAAARNLRALQICQHENFFPGYPEELLPISLPRYAESALAYDPN